MPVKIDEAQVSHIAHLARLKLTDSEVNSFRNQLSNILEYVEKLGEVNTDGVEPTAHAIAVCNVFRDDLPGPSLSPAQALANAPAKDAPFFKVPKVLDQETA